MSFASIVRRFSEHFTAPSHVSFSRYKLRTIVKYINLFLVCTIGFTSAACCKLIGYFSQQQSVYLWTSHHVSQNMSIRPYNKIAAIADQEADELIVSAADVSLSLQHVSFDHLELLVLGCTLRMWVRLPSVSQSGRAQGWGV